MNLNKLKFIIPISLAILMLAISGCTQLTTETPSKPEVVSPDTSSDITEKDDTGEHISDWVAPTPDSDSITLNSIADVVAKIKPAVLAINTEVLTYDYFNRPFTQQSAGSGWIISEDGIVVTNNHVVEGAKNITVTLDDGRILSVDTSTIATDPLTDLAVMKIDAENLTPIGVGNSEELRVGDWVVAIGNSLGERISATNGIVSAQGITLAVTETQTLYDLIQTDAAINPGNSGGPLVNMAGEVIGINSAKIAEVGVEGMGYSISINSALPIIESLVTKGYMIRPWMGINLLTVTEGLAKQYGFTVNEGALLTSIGKGSPADEAGLEIGDIVIIFNGEEITNTDDMIKGIRNVTIGQKVDITYWRGDSKYKTIITLIESPPPQN
ncbi:S1C family serine protease [Chloroflexota bacterium]